MAAVFATMLVACLTSKVAQLQKTKVYSLVAAFVLRLQVAM